MSDFLRLAIGLVIGLNVFALLFLALLYLVGKRNDPTVLTDFEECAADPPPDIPLPDRFVLKSDGKWVCNKQMQLPTL